MILKNKRVMAGFTQQYVADAVGVTQGTVYQWEYGLCRPRVEMLEKLADLYKCSVDELLGRENSA